MPRRSLLRAALGGGALLGAAPLLAATASADPAPRRRHAPDHRWVGAGPMRHVYDPSPSADDPRYLNDHCTIRAADGTWHLFAITGKTAPPGKVPDSNVEDNLAHATAPGLHGPWTTQPYALTTDPSYHGEDHLWAPHVVEHEGTYYLFYAAGAADPDAGWAINLATSTDLHDWTRDPDGPLFRHGLAARDPMVRRVGEEWVLYYTEVDDSGHHIIAARTSPDLRSWSDARAVYTDPITTDSWSVTESPFVVDRDGWWYLFTGPRNGYTGTDVFASRDPFAFELTDYAGHVPAHCAEVAHDGDDWWVTAAGWFQGGLNVAPLHWRDAPPLWHSPANPAAALDVTGAVRLFALADDRSTLLSRGLDGDWEEFGTGLATVPTVGADPDGKLSVFALRPNGTLSARTQDGDGGWGDWRDLGGPLGAAPAVGVASDGRLELFALAPGGGGLLHCRQTGPGADAFGDWEDFGGPAGAPPAVAANADGRLEVVALGPGGANLAHRWQTAPGGAWSDWDGDFGTPAGGAPSIALGAGDRLQVMAIAPTGAGLFHRAQSAPNGGWEKWGQVGGDETDATATLAAGADGRLEAFFMAPGGGLLYHSYQGADGSWSERDEFGPGTAASTPSACRDADGRVHVFAVDPDGTVRTRSQTTPSGGWGDWKPLGGKAIAPVPAGSAT